MEEAPSLSVASPRISSVGAPSEEGGRAGERPHMAYQAYTDSLGHDHIHWGGLGQRAGDARSVACSAAADRDDKSLYEDPGVLDATEGEQPRCRGRAGAASGRAPPLPTQARTLAPQRARSTTRTTMMRSPRRSR